MAALQAVAQGAEPQEFVEALERCAADSERPAISVCAQCPWLGAQYEVGGLLLESSELWAPLCCQ